MRLLPTLFVAVVLSSPALAQLPADAEAVVAAYEKKAAGIREKAERETQPHLDKAIAALQALQDTYCQQKRLDEAVAIRDRIRSLRGILPDPGALAVRPQDIGRTFLFDVVGSTEGSVWGTEVYTSDTHVGAAAVHLGILKPGERGVVKVRVIEGQREYRGTTRNGVTSVDYGPWGVSFVISRFSEGGKSAN